MKPIPVISVSLICAALLLSGCSTQQGDSMQAGQNEISDSSSPKNTSAPEVAEPADIALQKRIEQLENELESTISNTSDQQQLQNALDTAEQRIAQLTADVEAGEQQIKDLEAALADAGQAGGTIVQQEAQQFMNNEHDQLVKDLEQTQEQYQQVLDQLSSAQDRIDDLEQELNDYRLADTNASGEVLSND